MMLLDYIRSLPAYSKLVNVHSTDEGNLLETTDRDTSEAQISFFIWALAKADAFNVLEIGTNKGLFGLLLSVISPDVELTTIDINPDSLKAVDILNIDTSLNNFAWFIYGDSLEVMPTLEDEFDFAWIDGHHGYERALSDLRQCDRLSIPYVAIDDTNMETVAAALRTFLEETNYKEIPNPFISKDARKARLLTNT